MTDGNTTILIVIIVAALAAAIAGWLLLRSGRRARPPVLSERPADERPYVRGQPPSPSAAPVPKAAQGAGVTDEISTATTDIVGDVLSVDCHDPDPARDDLQRLKGVGPKLAARLNELGVTKYGHLAGLGLNEVAMLDDRLGPFKGRVARDCLVEQAQYLVRGDIEGFEARFGRLGGKG